jgi:protein involved in polysaccharide export with SLBB domain
MKTLFRHTGVLAGCLLLAAQTGCSSLYPIRGIPASRLPQALQSKSREALIDLDLVRLRQDPSETYELASGDVLGIFIEGVLGQSDQAPPVNFTEGLPPSIGLPFPVREDGTISLPLISALKVEGMSVAQAEQAIRKAYTVDRKILRQGQERIIVTLVKKRVYRVMVVREESAVQQPQFQATRNTFQNISQQSSRRGTGSTVELPAGENDVLHALNLTGGLPGPDARNEIQILRGQFSGAEERDRILAQLQSGADPCSCVRKRDVIDGNVVRVPLRYDPAKPPQFTQDDIILGDGDIVMIKSREYEVFYTGGLLGGGEFLLPRDRDLDVMGAIALAGGPIGGGGNQNGRGLFMGGGGGLGALIPPTEILVIRKTCNGSIPIRLDLNKAITGQGGKVIIQPGDLVMLRYKPQELVGNMILSSVSFNFLFNDIFRR